MDGIRLTLTITKHHLFLTITKTFVVHGANHLLFD